MLQTLRSVCSANWTAPVRRLFITTNMAAFALSAVRSLQKQIRWHKTVLGTHSNRQNVHTSGLKAAETETIAANSTKAELNLSDSCIKRLQDIATDGNFLRVTVEGGGCSGFQYKFCLDSKLSDDDRMFTKNGASVVIDETSLEYVRGSTIDFHTELIRSAFRIVNNPLSEQACSCGASFSIKL